MLAVILIASAVVYWQTKVAAAASSELRRLREENARLHMELALSVDEVMRRERTRIEWKGNPSTEWIVMYDGDGAPIAQEVWSGQQEVKVQE